MVPGTIRVAVRLEETADKDAVLSAAEERLGRAPELVWRFRDAPVLVLRLRPGELEAIRELPGVLSVRQEKATPLPPRPGKPFSDR